MQVSYTHVLIIIIGSLLFEGCEKDHIVKDGMKPIYIRYDDFSGLKSGPPLPYQNLGKIVSAGQFIFINEIGKGIHVINNSNPNEPNQIYFWSIVGNTEFTIFQNVLYANNGKDLLIIDITNFDNISLSKIIKDQYLLDILELYPENYTGYFECYNYKLGILKGWEKGELINPYCKTN
jgi:hypothetical protein